LTVGPGVRGDDAPVAPEGYKMTKVKLSGGGYIYSQESDPFRNVHSSSGSDQYKPDNMDFSKTSPMAHQQFSTAPADVSREDALADSRSGSSFVTKAYDDPHLPSSAIPNEETKYSLPSASPYSHRSANFDKSFATASSSLADKKMTDYDKTSPDANRTAYLGTGKTDVFAYPLADKTYSGPEANEVKKDLSKINNGMMSLKDLPDRPLTIDEVRELINHGVKPDTSAPPPPPSKALNDPDYQPEAEPEAPPEAPAPVNDDDKNDPVPSPGTIAQPPENSEALPQH
jgi:hypothetical protein